MGLRATFAVASLAALAGAGGAAWWLWPDHSAGAGKMIEPKPPELARPVEGPAVPVAPVVIQTQAPADQTAALIRMLDRYQGALLAALNEQRAKDGLPPVNSEIGPEIATSGAVALGERRIGPGPHGDEADIGLLQPCADCPIELLVKWDPPPPPQPAPRFKFERRYFLEFGPVVTSSGYGALVAGGLDGIRLGRSGRASLVLRAGGIIAPDPAIYAGAVVRWDWEPR